MTDWPEGGDSREAGINAITPVSSEDTTNDQAADVERTLSEIARNWREGPPMDLTSELPDIGPYEVETRYDFGNPTVAESSLCPKLSDGSNLLQVSIRTYRPASGWAPPANRGRGKHVEGDIAYDVAAKWNRGGRTRFYRLSEEAEATLIDWHRGAIARRG